MQAATGEEQGIFAAHQIAALAKAGGILPAAPFAENQIQPASLDLRLGRRAWRMRASFLPCACSVMGRNRKARAARDRPWPRGGAGDWLRLCRGAGGIALPCRPTSPPPPIRKARPAASTSLPASLPTGPAPSTPWEAGYRGPLFAESRRAPSRFCAQRLAPVADPLSARRSKARRRRPRRPATRKEFGFGRKSLLRRRRFDLHRLFRALATAG